MRTLDRLRHLVRVVLRRKSVERDLSDELSDWVDELSARASSRGRLAAEARRRALADVGRDRIAQARSARSTADARLQGLPDDFRYAWRVLRALAGIHDRRRAHARARHRRQHGDLQRGPRDASRAVAVSRSGRLVFVWSDMTSSGYPRAPLSSPELADLRQRATQFDGFGSIWATSTTLTDGEPEQLRTGLVTTNFFSVARRRCGTWTHLRSSGRRAIAPRSQEPVLF